MTSFKGKMGLRNYEYTGYIPYLYPHYTHNLFYSPHFQPKITSPNKRNKSILSQPDQIHIIQASSTVFL